MQSGSTPNVDDYFSGLQNPNIDDMQLQLQKLVQQGVLDPAQAQAYLVEQSEMSGVSQDPATRQAQMEALQGLQDITSSGGLTAIDKAKLGQIGTEEATRSRGAREAILQNAQARGLGGSGIELMSQMQNQQEAAGRTSQRDMDVAAMAQQRALDALMNQGALSSQIGSQQFSQDAQRAQAADAIAKFNAANQQSNSQYNTSALNQAQAANLAAKQSIANANAATSNQQQQYNKELIQKQFDNDIKKRSGQAGIATTNAQAQGANSQAEANANNALIGAGIGAAAGPVGSYFGSKLTEPKAKGGIIEGPNSNFDNMITPTMSGEFVVRKDDVPDFLKKAHTDEDGEFDAAAFLDSITGHKYNYKGKK